MSTDSVLLISSFADEIIRLLDASRISAGGCSSNITHDEWAESLASSAHMVLRLYTLSSDEWMIGYQLLFLACVVDILYKLY